ncbi:hypothetical protein D3C71_1546910 [compost metagenome]
MCAKPTFTSNSIARSRASLWLTFATVMGASSRLRMTLKWGKRLKLWKTKPMRLRKLFTSVFGLCTSSPLTMTRPFEIGSSRLTVRINVDLPEPEGPHTTTTSPCLTVSLIWLRA